MGTAPRNFPPESDQPIGQIVTGNKTGLTASLAQTVFFTAPSTGLYLVGLAVRIRSTNGAGQLEAVLTTPHSGEIQVGICGDPGDIVTAVVKDLDVSRPSDGYGAMCPVWMTAGDQLKVTTTATGLTGTTYDVYVVAQRAF